MKRLLFFVLAVAVLVLASGARADAAAGVNARADDGVSYYVSLGDSFAQSYQLIGGSPFGGTTRAMPISC